jgi:hypothetical protein
MILPIAIPILADGVDTPFPLSALGDGVVVVTAVLEPAVTLYMGYPRYKQLAAVFVCAVTMHDWHSVDVDSLEQVSLQLSYTLNVSLRQDEQVELVLGGISTIQLSDDGAEVKHWAMAVLFPKVAISSKPHGGADSSLEETDSDSPKQ